jgi:hypothetical protein
MVLVVILGIEIALVVLALVVLVITCTRQSNPVVTNNYFTMTSFMITHFNFNQVSSRIFTRLATLLHLAMLQ